MHSDFARSICLVFHERRPLRGGGRFPGNVVKLGRGDIAHTRVARILSNRENAQHSPAFFPCGPCPGRIPSSIPSRLILELPIQPPELKTRMRAVC